MSDKRGAQRAAAARHSHRGQHPVGRLRAAGRRSRARGRSRRRPHSLRRDGQPLRSEPDHRPDGVRGAAPAHPGDHRRAPDGEAGRPHRPRLRQRRRRHHQLPSGSLRARRPHHRPDQGGRLQGRPGAQPGHAARVPRSRAGRARPGADHVGEPGLRRPALHPLYAGQAARGAQPHRRERPRHAGSRSTAASRWTTSPQRRARAPTPSWPARRSSAARTTRRPSPRCAPSWPRC